MLEELKDANKNTQVWMTSPLKHTKQLAKTVLVDITKIEFESSNVCTYGVQPKISSLPPPTNKREYQP